MSRVKKLQALYKELTPITTAYSYGVGIGLGAFKSYDDCRYTNYNTLQTVVLSTKTILRASTVFAVMCGLFWPVAMPMFCYDLFKGDMYFTLKLGDIAGLLC